tara:strand:- start:10664 stop:11077 length:414 start_codon:yes stop_codon:yes gene_type:complete
MNIIKITLLKYISKKKIDFLSNNDIKIQLVYNGYIIETECINNKNNPLINKDFIFHYVKGIPLIINIYDTNNVLGDILLEKIIKEDFKDFEYLNSNLKYYYEIVNNDNLILYKYFQNLKRQKLIKMIENLNKYKDVL